MRLVDGVQYRMEGSFSKFKRVYRPRPVFFQGQVTADRLGCLTGAMVDENGPATFNGHLILNIHNDHIVFSKQYDRDHSLYRGGSDLPIEYELTLNLSGGWVGTWKITSGDEADHGYVILAIVPWGGGFGPLNPDLVDYLTLLEAVKSF